MIRLLLSLSAVIGIAFATYASAAVFSTASDPDLRCDTEGVTGTWILDPGLNNVQGLQLNDIDPSCVDAETYAQALAGDTLLAASGTTLASGNVGSGNVVIPLSPQSIQSVTGLSVLMHKGSEAATGPAGEVPCALDGMRIQGWGVDNPTAMVSSIRLTGIDSDCIGSEIVAVLDEGGNFLAEARATLTTGNTGANILTLPLPSPLRVSVVTGIEIYVEGEVEPEEPGNPNPPETPGTTGTGSVTATGGGTTTNPPGRSSTTTTTPSNQSNAAGARSTGGSSGTSSPGLISEVAGVRGLPSTGMGFIDKTEAGQALYYFAVIMLAAGALLVAYALRPRRRRRLYQRQ